jgi:7-carboxy-7-deazaguanine synthase
VAYQVKEIYYTLQGEGAQTGRAAVFCRFAGCNLWNGREDGREDAVCKFCDTDFIGTDGPGGGKFATAADLAKAVAKCWDAASVSRAHACVVCTGGEPLLQLDEAAIAAFHAEGIFVAIETNGTQQAPTSLDWICVSPKAGAALDQRNGHELKLVFPQDEPEAHPERFATLQFEHFFLQPKDGPGREANTQAAMAYCRAHPQWRLSLQTHKLLGIP